MNKMIIITLVILFISMFVFTQTAKCEEIHFNNNIFLLKKSYYSEENKGYVNEYYPKNENREDWSKMVAIYYYPEVSNPIKFADNEDKKVEETETDVLLKFIQNKKSDKAALSYLENGSANGRNFFERNIYKYEKHPDKGMMVLRYAERYFFISDSEITQIGNNVKQDNDKYLELIVSSPIPPVVEKDID